jgi:4-amino-4-deoxy-L-arabinose transferase-like glycosyltransferase
MVLAVGHEFQLGTDLGPPLAFWLAEVVYALSGLIGVYLLAQVCIVVAYWAVFQLGRALVGAQQAAIAVLLMVGILVMTVPSPDFGPTVLGAALAALMMLHFWRAIGEGRRHYWFVLAFDLGLLLLTTYAGLILFACLTLFMCGTERGRAALRTVEPWFAAIVVAVLLFPHLIWLDSSGDTTFGPLLARLHSREAADTNLLAWLWLLATVAAAHVGLVLLVALASGWWRQPSHQLPTFVRPPLDPFARQLVYFMALAPALVATLLAAIAGAPAPVGGVAPYVTLSGLAAVVAAGDAIVIHRQRIVGLAWMLILLLPAAFTVAAIIVVPWTLAVELKSAQPASQMGEYFGDSFQKRTGKPLAIVAGDERLATLVALAAPSRPSYYDLAAPARTPWVTDDDIRKRGLIVVWPAHDTLGLPPADVKARFPDLVPEVPPRKFGYAHEGMMSPALLIGWGVIRPVDQAPAAPPR